MENNLKVTIWGKEVGRLTWDRRQKKSVFEYAPSFIKNGIDIAPLTASIHNPRYQRPFYGYTNDNVFYGLPPFISDSLPGRWGNTVFAAWAQANNIRSSELTPVDKLSFIGQRAMGALEFEPSQPIGTGMSLQLDDLYRKAQEILENREETVIAGKDLTLESLYEVGTSAGGQHTKAVIARNNKTGEIRSGQILLPPDYTYYILKFAEKDFYPLTIIEKVYYDMALEAGLQMMPSELINIGGDSHFLTQRFDRKNGKKIHTQTLAAMNPEASSYEDLMAVCDDLGLPYKEKEAAYRQMVFNVLTTNVDAHIRNFSFLMEEGGSWHLTPAYDLTFSCFNPGNNFDPDHYLRVCGKTTAITHDDLVKFARENDIKRPEEIISQVVDAVKQFREFATKEKVSPYWIDKVEGHFVDMNPELLKSLTGFKPLCFDYYLKEEGIMVKDAQWTEMGNGAMRLTATLNDVPYRLTFSASSSKGKAVMEQGGIKMPEDLQRKYVLEYFVPRYKERHNNA